MAVGVAAGMEGFGGRDTAGAGRVVIILIGPGAGAAIGGAAIGGAATGEAVIGAARGAVIGGAVVGASRIERRSKNSVAARSYRSSCGRESLVTRFPGSSCLASSFISSLRDNARVPYLDVQPRQPAIKSDAIRAVYFRE
jgi:hypothetical protein